MTDSPLPFATRLWFAWVCWLRVLFDGSFAARVFAAASAPAPLAPAEPRSPVRDAERAASAQPAPPAVSVEAPEPQASALDGALQLLSLLQREGRFVDFLQQEITGFPDADIGAAARVVHEGCRRVLRQHARVVSVRSEAEGATVSVPADEVVRVNLVGNVSGPAPYRGVLRHRGWRIEGLTLPTRVGRQELSVVAPAEVEL